MVSGAYIGTDLMDNRFSDASVQERDRAFATGLLGYSWHMNKGTVIGKVESVASPFRIFSGHRLAFETGPSRESYAVESADAIHPSGTDAFAIMRYEDTGLTAATALERVSPPGLPYRVVAFGFPFETIHGEHERRELMTDVLKFLCARPSHAAVR